MQIFRRVPLRASTPVPLQNRAEAMPTDESPYRGRDVFPSRACYNDRRSYTQRYASRYEITVPGIRPAAILTMAHTGGRFPILQNGSLFRWSPIGAWHCL